MNSYLCTGKVQAKKFCQQFKKEDCINNGCFYWESCLATDPFFFKSDGIFLFEKMFEEPQLKVEDVSAEYDNETMFLTLKAKNIECTENKVKVTYIEPKEYLKPIKNLEMEPSMNLTKLMPHRHKCIEYQVKLEISSVNSTQVWSGFFQLYHTCGAANSFRWKVRV